MAAKVGSPLLLGFFPLFIAGCPVTDAYFIDTGGAASGGQVDGMGGAVPAGGKASGGSSAAGTSSGNAGAGGVSEPSGGAPLGSGGASSETCTPSTERCNGHDDNCNDVIDEQACNSLPSGTMGCSGFVVSARPAHGYMLCTEVTRDHAQAQEACRAQGMRLAWLESEQENVAVSTRVDAIESGLEAWLGATDREMEGSWRWEGQGGELFWGGHEFGNPVGGAYVAWADATPNNSADSSPEGEDCAVLLAAGAVWGDRACTIKYAYLCEEPEPPR